MKGMHLSHFTIISCFIRLPRGVPSSWSALPHNQAILDLCPAGWTPFGDRLCLFISCLRRDLWSETGSPQMSSLGRTSSGHRVASSRTNYASGRVPDNQAECPLDILYSAVVTGRGKCGRFQLHRIQQMKAPLRSKLLAQSLQGKSRC